MSHYYTKYSVFSIITAFLAMVVILFGCTDDIIYNEIEIPDAEVELCGEVIFKPLVPTEVKTRAEAPDGTKYRGIKTLHVFFFDSDKNIIKEYSGKVDFTPSPSEGSTHEHVSFKKRVLAGRYYVYAVANISADQTSDIMNVKTVDELRNFKLVWDNDIEKDLEMFGVFRLSTSETTTTPGNEDFEKDELLTINKNLDIHSWVRRATSKVTVDFDGTNLKEGVTVYIKKATLKDVASGALLGAATSVGSDGFVCTQSEYSLNYGTGEEYGIWPTVTKSKSFSPSEVWGDQKDADSFHDDNAKALPCYENMQGEPEGKSKLQDSDGDGIIDSATKDGVENGTYLEVEGYYVANRPEYKSHGKIIYRFMLGKDAVKNFDLIRNHHYKITMQFKDYGNDIDWHIEYAEKYLDATYPKDVNYQGNFFVPDNDYSAFMANAGHNFNNQNIITVTSYETDGTSKKWIEPVITYTYYSYNEKTDAWEENNSTTRWLTTTPGEISEDGSQKTYTFVASMTDPISSTINALFPSKPEGTKSSPYNLSNKAGEMQVENTANCYMVGAPGWYCFPLVYGNAINNPEAYSSAHMVNHLNKHITKPYIKDNPGIDLSDVSVKLIWQDAENLIPPSEISYDPALFNNKGGIKFHISDIKEGNAVIALIDNNADEDEFVNYDRTDDSNGVYELTGSTKAIWSWHIWATRFGFGDFENDIKIFNHEEEPYDVMPVNLGWCAGEKAIKYYKRRKCEVKFKVGEHEIVREIVQYPHFVLPRGDHPYYQWGRKDPFVGTTVIPYDPGYGNKKRWDHDGKLYDVWSQYSPPRLYKDYAKEFNHNAERKSTIHCLDVLIKNPDKWHNATREVKTYGSDGFPSEFRSINESFPDLWSYASQKTVYDPCPPGYQVSDNKAFTGFTTHGMEAMYPYDWYDVIESNMQQDYYGDTSINKQVLELYTSPKKLQSITFPVSGYRDFDSKAWVYQYPTETLMGEGYVWFNNAEDGDLTNSYHFKFHRNDIQGESWKDRGAGKELNLIAPYESYYNTDGFAVRPVRCYTK